MAASVVPPNTAKGTFFSGFSTASTLAQADSIPNKPQMVTAIDCVMAEPVDRSFTFQFSTYNGNEK